MPTITGIRDRVTRRFGDRLDPNEAYLSYHDVRLTRMDYDSIKDDWLTDTVIAFWEEYLERVKLSKYPQASISLLRPTMAYMVLQSKDFDQLKSALPDFSKTTHIFLPINDNPNSEMAEGGSHWSLLLVSTIDRVAFHYDSLGNANQPQARVVAQKLGRLIKKELSFINMEDSPIQENSSDCGVFVCLIMQHLLLKRLLVVDSKRKISMSMAGREVDARKGRVEMRHIINDFREEGQRRKSRSTSRGKDRSNTPPRIC